MANIIYIILIIFVNFISTIFVSLRYRSVLGCLEQKISRTSAFIIFCISSTINYLIPFKGGLLVGGPTSAKIRENISIKKSAIILVFEQLFEAMWQLTFVLFALFFTGDKFFNNNFFNFFNIIILILSIIIVIYFIIDYNKLIKILVKVYSFFPNRLKKIISKFVLKENAEEIFNSLKLLLTKRIFILKYFLRTVIIILFTPLNLFFIMIAFSFYINFYYVLIIFWVSFILGKLSGLPGGLGVRDVTIGAFLVKLGISTSSAVKIVFIHRILSLFPVIPVGIIFLLVFSKGKLKPIYDKLFL